ncbi:MAG: SMP-30/gluconolactonase/LRE family protein [Spirochaetales bacterium]|nr:SMP-30/gluconolactonase/LRE family protein [Spirochaetales bacterium]
MKSTIKKFAIVAVILLCMTILPVFGQTTIRSGAGLVQVYSSNLYYEGPTWDPVNQKLYFTTPNDAPYNIYSLNSQGQVSVWMSNSQRVNGTFLSIDGRLLAAESQSQKITSYRIGANGPEDAQTIASDTSWYYPNDICQRPQGDIYFTTPNWEGRPQAVYHINTQGVASRIISDMGCPNGIITSNDGSKLYVSDSNRKYWMVYPINSDGSIGTGSVFFNPGSGSTNDPDGMTIDEHGNLYFMGKGGLWIVSPSGEQLDFISIPEFCSNITFGGSDGSVLYITCQDKIYSLKTTVRGANWAPTATIPPSSTPPGQIGDVNINGSIDIVDALLIAQYYVGLEPSNFEPALADVNCSGGIDIVDALLTARYYVGQIDSFPC